MKDLLVSEDIIPIGEFKKQASRLLRRVKEQGRPLLITQNGTPVSVVVSPREYDRIREQARLVASATEGLRQSEAGTTLSGPEVDEELDRAFGPRRKVKTR